LLSRRQPPQSGGLPRRYAFFTILILRAPPKNSSKNEKKAYLLGSALTRGRRD
jgi:hypothetical protein